eukprot:518971-Amorphochlora_amoeboformis.AAC.2
MPDLSLNKDIVDVEVGHRAKPLSGTEPEKLRRILGKKKSAVAARSPREHRPLRTTPETQHVSGASHSPQELEIITADIHLVNLSMPRQKKRKNGGGDKKRKDRPKSESKKTTYPPNPQSPAEPPNKHQGASLRGTTSWIDELCRIDPDKLSPKIREMLSLASEPMQKNYVETPYRNGGRSCPSQANQNSASPSQRAGTSKAWLLDRKHSSAGRKYPRFQTLNDEFVGASLAGTL